MASHNLTSPGRNSCIFPSTCTSISPAPPLSSRGPYEYIKTYTHIITSPSTILGLSSTMELVGFGILQGVVAITRCGIELTRFLSCNGDRRLFCNSRNDDIVISTDEIDDDDGGEELTADDVTVVLERLGIDQFVERGREGKAVVEELLEEKEASEWELKEAFYVFDRNEDGFITAEELWNVMRRLGFEEGRRVENCERMIRAFDEDGDGKISFLEFKRLLENTM